MLPPKTTLYYMAGAQYDVERLYPYIIYGRTSKIFKISIYNLNTDLKWVTDPTYTTTVKECIPTSPLNRNRS